MRLSFQASTYATESGRAEALLDGIEMEMMKHGAFPSRLERGQIGLHDKNGQLSDALVIVGPETREALYLAGVAAGLNMPTYWTSREKAGLGPWWGNPNDMMGSLLEFAESTVLMTPPPWQPPSRDSYTADLKSLINHIVGSTPEQYMKYNKEHGLIDPDPNRDHLRLTVDVLDLMSLPNSGWEYLAYWHTCPEMIEVRRLTKEVQRIQQDIQLMGIGLVRPEQTDELKATLKLLKVAQGKIKPYEPEAA
jgi:hypothetical protein